jgi:hypothetical protein
MTGALLILALAVVSEAEASPRIVPFTHGHTSVESNGDVDHVIVQDATGNLMSESWCDSGSFSDYFELFAKFRDAIAVGNREGVLRLVDYPLRVNCSKKPVLFKTASSLSKSYSKVFTIEVQQEILKAEPAAVSCRNGQAMLGAGVIWANRAGVAILNAPAGSGTGRVCFGRAEDGGLMNLHVVRLLASRHGRSREVAQLRGGESSCVDLEVGTWSLEARSTRP